MADENINDIEELSVKISDLPQATVVDNNNDYLIISHPSSSSTSDYITYKINPNQLASQGAVYTAGAHIDITSNVISATYDAATTSASGLMSSTDKSKLDNIEANANAYTLPPATTSTLGGIVVGSGLAIDANTNELSTNISDATTSTSGLMSATDKTKLDSVESGANAYSLPTAASNVKGGIMVGSGLTIDNSTAVLSTNISDATTSASGLMSSTDKTKLNGIETNANNYSLPTASANDLGGIKVGSGLSIDSSGVLSATGGGGTSYTAGAHIDITGGVISATYDNATQSVDGLMSSADKTKLDGLSNYSLPIATDQALGGIKVGSGLTIDSSTGVLSTTGGGGGGSSTLSGLSDVTITSPQANQVLKYNGSGQWINTASSASDLDDLADVTISSVSDKQSLVYDGTSQLWKNASIDYTDLSNTPTIPDGLADLTDDVNITSPTDGQILKYDGNSSKWVNGTGGGGSSTLDGLTDVTITTPTNGQVLQYNGSGWINANGGGGSAQQTAVTQAEYNALVQAGTVDPTMEYFITDGIPYSVAPWTDITATLTAGQTSLVFSNAVITTNSTIEVFVNDAFYGVNPTAITLATGSVTLTFPAQASDMPVKVRVS